MAEKRINKKILKLLGSHFAVLGSDIRIIILRMLSNQKIPIEFNEIHKILQPYFSENINTAYHLKKLKNQNLIIGDDRGYLLTDLGIQIVEKMNEFENMLTSNPTILVRTSKYSLEEFDESIIEKNLILEANMIPSQAKSIANEAKIQLKLH